MTRGKETDVCVHVYFTLNTKIDTRLWSFGSRTMTRERERLAIKEDRQKIYMLVNIK